MKQEAERKIIEDRAAQQQSLVTVQDQTKALRLAETKLRQEIQAKHEADHELEAAQV